MAGVTRGTVSWRAPRDEGNKGSASRRKIGATPAQNDQFQTDAAPLEPEGDAACGLFHESPDSVEFQSVLHRRWKLQDDAISVCAAV